jgi:hypothetical protein
LFHFLVIFNALFSLSLSEPCRFRLVLPDFLNPHSPTPYFDALLLFLLPPLLLPSLWSLFLSNHTSFPAKATDDITPYAQPLIRTHSQTPSPLSHTHTRSPYFVHDTHIYREPPAAHTHELRTCNRYPDPQPDGLPIQLKKKARLSILLHTSYIHTYPSTRTIKKPYCRAEIEAGASTHAKRLPPLGSRGWPFCITSLFLFPSLSFLSFSLSLLCFVSHWRTKGRGAKQSWRASI